MLLSVRAEDMGASFGRSLGSSSSSSSSSSDRSTADLKEVENMHRGIQALLNDAEEREIRDDSDKLWLRELRCVSHDAEDILDEFQYELLRSRVESGGPSPNTRKRKQEEEEGDREVRDTLTSSISSSINPRIQEIKVRYREILAEKNALHLRKGDGLTRKRLKSTAGPPPSTHLQSDPLFVGRAEEIRLIIDILLDDESVGRNFTVLPIVGMRGVGKTTLAQHLFNHPEISGHFKPRGWVYAADNFELAKLTRAMIESVTTNPCRLKEPTALQIRLKQELMGKRFLIVLDHVWNEDPGLWKRLQGPLDSGARGSVVIVTTDSFAVAEIMGTLEFPYYLECLSSSDCWSLFQKLAFDGRNLDEQRTRVDVRQEIVEKCQGLPLAVKELALPLRCLSDGELWDDTLQRAIQDLDDQGNVLDLRLHHLPAHLKRCVAYCSLFPKGYQFRKDQLVRLWMAQGFIQSGEGKQVEDVGMEYFKKLSFRSLLQPSQTEEEAYEMHSIDHDLLAESILGKECCRVEEDNSCCFPSEALHASFVPHTVEAMVQFQSFKHSTLRTFLIIRTSKHISSTTIPRVQDLENMFLNFSRLRALDLSFTGIYELPDSIDNLKHLRYLGLNGTRIKGLPESICTLYHLQTLELKECVNLQGLPKDMKNLISLRHLDFDIKVSFYLPSGIEKLTSLRTLPRFNVGRRDGGYCGIQELKALSKLRGELHISGLCDVISVEDAMDALKHKPYLDKLTLTWPHDELAVSLHTGIDDSDLALKSTKEERMLKNLQPHTNLTQLVIQSYGGIRFPGWVGDSSFSKLEFVSLEDCNNCKVLPPFGQLQSLKFLSISSMIGGGMPVRFVGHEFCSSNNTNQISFPSLETLCLLGMPEWKEWDEPVEGDFPRLSKLTIKNCPKLRGIPNLLSSLTELEVVNCVELANLPTRLPALCKIAIKDCPKLRGVSGILSTLTELEELEMNCTDLSTFPILPALHQLQLCACKRLTHLPGLSSLKTLELRASKGLITISNLSSLCNLDLWACRGLTVLPDLPSLQCLKVMYCELESLPTFPNLQFLTVMYCSKLASISILPSLEELSIEDCEQLMSIDLSSSSSILKNLLIVDCPLLQFSPEEKLPNTLDNVYIDGCPSISNWCRRYGDSKLGHIPNVFIDGHWAD